MWSEDPLTPLGGLKNERVKMLSEKVIINNDNELNAFIDNLDSSYLIRRPIYLDVIYTNVMNYMFLIQKLMEPPS